MADSILDGNGNGYFLTVNSDGSINTTTSGAVLEDFTLRYIQKIDYSGGVPIYIGLAVPGTSEDTAGWHIRKNTYEGYNITEVLFASGTSSFVNKWSGTTINRTTYPYL